MNAVSSQLASLVRQATRGSRRLVIFVDDLERCRPPRAVEVCEVASQLLGHRDVVTVLVADMAMIAQSAHMKYAQVDGGLAGVDRAEYGRHFLEKIVQIQFEVPGTPANAMQEALRANPELFVPPEPEPVRRSRLRRLGRWLLGWRVIGAGLALTLVPFVVVAGVAADANGDIEDGRVGGIANTLLALSVVPLAFAAYKLVTDTVRRLGRRALRRRVDEEIEKHKAAVEHAAPEEFADQIRTASDVQDSALVEQLVNRYLTDRSLAHEVRADLLTFVRPRPRTVKRTMNHRYLLTGIALRRGLLAPLGDLEPDHIMKWVVLEDRWPTLKQRVVADPSLLAQLEDAAGRDDVPALSSALASLGIEQLLSHDLVAFLAAGPPLAPVATELVFFAAPPTAA